MTSAVELRVHGGASLNINNGNVIAIVSDLTVTMATADVNTGNPQIGTLSAASVLSFTIGSAKLFAGIGGKFNSDRTDIDTSSSDWLPCHQRQSRPRHCQEGHHQLHRPAGHHHRRDVGRVTQPIISISGTVLVNSSNVVGGHRINWATATTTPGTLLPSFPPELDSNVLLSIVGAATVDVFGFVTLTGTFTFKKAVGSFAVTEAAANTTTTLSNVEYLTVGAHIASATIAVGGIGLTLTDIDFAMLMVTTTGATPVKYTAIKASIGGATLSGVTGLVLTVGSLFLEVNQSSDATKPNKVLDFKDTVGFTFDNGKAAPLTIATSASAADDQTLDMDGNDGALLKIAGTLTINAFGFVRLSGTFAFEKATATFAVTDAATNQTTTLSNVPYLTIGGTVTSAFAGVPGNTSTTTDDLGFNLTGVEFGILMVSSGGLTPVNYTALKANVTDASFVGVPGLTVGVTSLSIVINQTTDTVHPNKVLDFKDTTTDPGDGAAAPFAVSTGPTSDITLDIDGNEGSLVSLAGSLSFNLFGFVSLNGNFSVKKA